MRCYSFLNKKNVFLFLLFLGISGCISLFYGQDVCFDLLNYHLYIPYSFLHARFSTDLIAAGALHTFFNPLLDVPSYLLFKHLNNFPHLSVFLMGGYYAFLLLVTWKIIKAVFPSQDSADKLLQIIILFSSCTGLATLWQVGRFTNEIATATFILLSLLFLIKGTKEDFKIDLKYIYLSAFIVMFVTGLKYTAIIGAAGIALNILYLLIKNKCSWKIYTSTLLWALGGFLLADGFFMIRKFIVLGNPFFPYANQIFKSPYFIPDWLPNGPFSPQNIKEFLCLPFLRTNFTLEYKVDFRLIFGYLSFFIMMIWQRFNTTKTPPKNILLFSFFYLGSYFTWVLLFGNMRYIVCMEIVSVLLLASILINFVSKKMLTFFLLIVFGAIIVAKPISTYARQQIQSQNISITPLPIVPNNSLVLIAGHNSFLIPFLNSNAKYVGGIWFPPEKFPTIEPKELYFFNRLQPNDYKHHFLPEIKKQVAKAQSDIFVIAPDVMAIITNKSFWKDYGIEIDELAKNCSFFTSSLDRINSSFVFCKAKKI